MAKIWNDFVVTLAGQELRALATAETKPIEFTTFKIGSGEFPGDPTNLTDLINFEQLVPIIDLSTVTSTQVLIRGYLNNTLYATSFNWAEIGIYAQVQGDPTTEILYGYSSSVDPGTGDIRAGIIPAGTEAPYERDLDVYTTITAEVSVTFAPTFVKDKWAFSNKQDMINASYLREHDKIELWGDASLGDKAVIYYIATTTVTSIPLLPTGLYAQEVPSVIIYGITENTSLEGKQRGIIMGTDDLGMLSTPGLKKVDEAYEYDGVMYLCLTENSDINPSNATNWEAMSNMQLAKKLKNLYRLEVIPAVTGEIQVTDDEFAFAIFRMKDISSGFYWSSHIVVSATENWIYRYDNPKTLQIGKIQKTGNVFTYQPQQGTNSMIDAAYIYYLKNY